MLAHVGRDNAFRRFTIGELLEQQRRIDSVTRMIIAPGVLGAHPGVVLTPGVDGQRLLQHGQQRIQVTLQRNVRLAQLIHFRRVDIHMDNFRVRREGIQLTGHTVVKARADGDQQVTFLYRQVSSFGAMHPQHTEVERVVCRYRAQTFQGASRGHLRHRHKFTQRRNRLCHPNTTTNVQHRFVRLRQHLLSLRHFGVRENIVTFDGGEERVQFALRDLHILRNIHQDRAWTA